MAERARALLFDWRWVAAAAALLLVFDLADAAFYVGHILSVHGQAPAWLQTPLFDMNREFGLGEDLEYGKSLVSAGALALCARRARDAIFALLAGLHVWLAADNALALHEGLGVLIGDHILGGATLGLARPSDLGQLVFYGVFGAVLLALLFALLRRTRPEYARTGLVLFLAAGSPGVFGVFVDAFQATPIAQPLSHTLLTLIEDGGETVMLSLATALSLGCMRHSRGWPVQAAESPAAARA